MSNFLLTVSLEASSGSGEDSHLVYDDAKTLVVGVFDGLGGRSAGFDGLKGGQIASVEAAQIVKKVLTQWSGKLTENITSQIQSTICQSLKSQADAKMPKSRLGGTLSGKRLCTTLALASINKQEKDFYEIDLAWIGDSRIYFLSPSKGLQQLTTDDLQVNKDAFQMIREDPPMSQYLTADIPADWHIHYGVEVIEENGCILACTDGCFQYLSTPWDFEKLLLKTLSLSNSTAEWENILAHEYEQIKQDDVSLLLYPVGFTNFESIKENYQQRLKELTLNYNSETSNFDDLSQFWNLYRSDYEARLKVSSNKIYDKVDKELETKEVELIPEYQVNFGDNVQKYESTTTSLEVVNHGIQIYLPEFHDRYSDIKKQILALLQEAQDYQKNLNLSAAIQKYQEILKIDSSNINANFRIGILYIDLDKFSNAISYLQKVYIEKKEHYYDSLMALAEGFYKTDTYDRANIYFDEINQNSEIYFTEDFMEMYADSLSRVARLEDALSVCKSIEKKNPRNAFIISLIGDIRCQQNCLSEAKKYLHRSLILYREKYEKTRSPFDAENLQIVERQYKEVCNRLKKRKYR